MKILILGLGNPILSDDGVGQEVVRKIGELCPQIPTIVKPWLDPEILYEVSGYEGLLVVDACITGSAKPGTLLFIGEASSRLLLGNTHGLTPFQVLDLGRALGMSMPSIVRVLGIEIPSKISIGTEQSPVISSQILDISLRILDYLPLLFAGEGPKSLLAFR